MTQREKRWYMVMRALSLTAAYITGLLISRHYEGMGTTFSYQLLVIVLCIAVGAGMGYTLGYLNRRFWDHRLYEPLTRKRNDHDDPTHDG